jgi:hypothetical protein
MELLNNIVKECLAQHKGGEEFFNHLDESVQDMSIVDQLVKNIYDHTKYSSDKVHYAIVSGKFGCFFHNRYRNASTIVVEGGLRITGVLDLSYMQETLYKKNVIFIDDSFYSGKTRNVVKAEVERCGGKLIDTYVIYDGSKEKDRNVHSLYRYYDNIKKIAR